MSAPESLTVGWCPGALRPMTSGDGLILRIKPRGAALGLAQARGLAAAAAAHGHGALDLTSRANLQIRGVAAEALAPLTAALGDLDLLDPSAEAEAVRNVVASPLAGHDPAAACDIRPAVAALEARLIEDPTLRALPGKFGFVVDDGGDFGLRACPADIGFEALRPAGAAVFAIRLAGAETGTAAGTISTETLPEAATALARVFLKARVENPALRRMRDCVARRGAVAVVAAAGLAAQPVALPPRPDFAPPIGIQRLGGTLLLGAAAPFGRLRADQLRALAEAAEACGATDLRLTPWRSMVLVAPAGADRPLIVALAKNLAQAGLVTDPADARLRIAACSGAPACPRASTPVLGDAARLAPLLAGALPGRGIILHVSGCAKGCAHAGPAPLLLVAEAGRYRLGRHAGADALGAGEAGRGPLLSFAEAAACLAASQGIGP